MMTVIKYELKKIYKNKLFIGILILSIIATLALSFYTLNLYKNGVIGDLAVNDMNSKKMDGIFVSNKNINELRAKLTEFEADDSIYEKFDPVNNRSHRQGGRMYRGKYETFKKDAESEIFIKKDVIPEYVELYYPVKKYDDYKARIEEIKGRPASSEPEYLIDLKYAEMDEKLLEEGFTVGYDYGWSNIFFSFSSNSGILLAIAIILGLCNVFTLEYSTSTDALLLSSKRGRTKLASCKIIASLIFTSICWAVYVAFITITSFSILGVEGSKITMIGQTYFGHSVTNLVGLVYGCLIMLAGCIVLSFITLAVSSVFTKPIPSIAISAFLGLFPIAISSAVYLPNYSILQIFSSMPISMIFGSSIERSYYMILFNNVLDTKIMFTPVCITLLLICIPTIYSQYCKHQVRN